MTTLASRLCLLSALSVAAAAQNSQDIQVSTIATGLVASARTLGVDGFGTVWVGNLGVLPQGGGTITGPFTPRSVTRGPGGLLNFLADRPGGGTDLYQLDYAGQPTLLASWPNLQAWSLAWIPPGTFYLSTSSDILSLPNVVATPTVYVTGLSGILGTGPTGKIFVAANHQVFEITGPEAAVLRNASSWPCYDTWAIESWYGHALVAAHCGDTADQWTAVYVAPEFGATVGILYDHICSTFSGCEPPPPALAPGLVGDVYLLSGDELLRISGLPALLAFWNPSPGVASLRLDAPAGSPVLIGMDSYPVSNLQFPGLGTAHTSLGTLPSFVVVADGVGAFGPPDPSAVAPWSLSVPVPFPPVGIPFFLEAYVPHPGAANGVIMISNVAHGYL